MIEAKKLFKIYHSGAEELAVLRGVDLFVGEGEFVSIMGPSGAGKSTLLYQLGLLDHPTAGTIVIGGVHTEILSSHARTRFRLLELGFVFQDYALVPELTALENVAITLLAQGRARRGRAPRGAGARERRAQRAP